MSGWVLIAVIFSVLAFGCCWFDFREIQRLKENLERKSMSIYNLDRRIENLESNAVRLSMSIDEHDARIKEFEGDSYDEV